MRLSFKNFHGIKLKNENNIERTKHNIERVTGSSQDLDNSIERTQNDIDPLALYRRQFEFFL